MDFMETIYTNIYDRSSQFSMMVASFLAPSDYRSKAQKFFGENASLTVLREGGGDDHPSSPPGLFLFIPLSPEVKSWS